jgi:hypothetical protein
MSRLEPEMLVRINRATLEGRAAHVRSGKTTHYTVFDGEAFVSPRRASEVRMTFTLTNCERKRCHGFVISETSVTVTSEYGKQTIFVWRPSEITTDDVQGLRKVWISELNQVEPPSKLIEFLEWQHRLPVVPMGFEAAERMDCHHCGGPIKPRAFMLIENSRDGFWRPIHGFGCPKEDK